MVGGEPLVREQIDDGVVVEEALARLAAAVDAVTVDLARAVVNVRTGWQGPYRSRFESERARREAQATALIVGCRRSAMR